MGLARRADDRRGAAPPRRRRAPRVRHGAQTWRLSFYDGWVQAVGERLQAARERAVAQAVETDESGTPGTALVLRAKEERVRSFYAENSSARGSWRGAYSGRTAVDRGATARGRSDGARADLGQPRIGQRGRLAR